MRDRSDRLRAFCSITIEDDFVVHDLRVIEGRKGFFVAMPSRKLTDSCPECGSKNELRARYCNNCGHKLDETRATEGPNARDKFHVDVAHPINTACREMIQKTVLAAYESEIERVEEGLSAQREYQHETLDEALEEYEEEEEEEEEEAEAPPETSAPEPAPTEAEEPPEPAPEPAADETVTEAEIQPGSEPEPAAEETVTEAEIQPGPEPVASEEMGQKPEVPPFLEETPGGPEVPEEEEEEPEEPEEEEPEEEEAEEEEGDLDDFGAGIL